MVAVAAIWEKAPASTQGQNRGGGFGKALLVTATRPAKKMSANGKPNRNRTWVAPTVPSVAVSSRCMALRAVCAAAAISVKTAQSIVRGFRSNRGNSAFLRHPEVRAQRASKGDGPGRSSFEGFASRSHLRMTVKGLRGGQFGG